MHSPNEVPEELTHRGEERSQMDSSPFSSVHQHPATADLYLRHGWKIIEIPFGSKAPIRTGWNRENGWVQSAAQLSSQCNLGLLHAFSGTCAIDIDDWDGAAAVLHDAGINLDQLYNAPDAVTIESSRPGRGKLLYEMPFPGFTLPSKKIVRDGKTILELRCGTSGGTSVQDVLPPSKHPETGQAYRWGGRGRWDNLPSIPLSLLNYWQQQLAVPERPQIDSQPFADWTEIEQALDAVPPGCDRETWLQVGMALHHEGMRSGNEGYAYHLFSKWSAGDPIDPPSNYAGQRDIDYVWRSFKRDEPNPVTIGTLFSHAAEHGWSKPVPDVEHLFNSVGDKPIDVFDGMRPVPPSANLSLVPEPLATRCAEVAQSVGCDPLVPLFAGLTAVCSAADARSRLKITDGYEVPPILWMLTIGDPSDKKSPGSRPMFSILRTLEREDLPSFKKKELEYKVAEDIYKMKYKEFLEWYSDEYHETENTVPPDEPFPPVKPHKLKLYVQDITSQKLLRDAADHPRGLLAYLDETNGWFQTLTNKFGSENRSTWVQGYEGGHGKMGRVTSEDIEADPFSVAVYGNAQPWIWREYLKPLASDGFITRFLVAPLRGQFSKLSNPIPDELSNRRQYEGMIRAIYAAPRQLFTLEPEAYRVFRENQQWIHDLQGEERILAKDHFDHAYMFAVGKSDGTVGRLALVFHLIKDPLNPVVSAETMRCAVKFYRTYALPALRYAYSEIGGVAVDTLDVWMASHILAICDSDYITLNKIKRSARRRIESFHPSIRSQIILDAVVPLEDAGWLAIVDSNPRTNEYTWAINPKLKEAFADYRRQILTIRQRRQDELRHVHSEARSMPIKRRLIPGYNPAWDNE